MTKKVIDLRSDTVTRPSHAMLQAMMSAPVGDDILGDDPTIKEFEKFAAEMLGKDSAIFTTSGTQSNLMAIMAHCGRGDEYIVGQQAHCYKWEGGGAAVLGGIQPQPLDFEADGTLDLNKAKAAIKPYDDHHARTKLLCIENTHHGKALPMAYLQSVQDFCQAQKLASHLDGARAFNAAVHHGIAIRNIAQHFDTVSICLSKGLGAPVGSFLAGPATLIREARRWRKVLGGGMRQAGILAAAGLYALENNVQGLAQDHAHAAMLGQGLEALEEISVIGVWTNMVFIEINKGSVRELQQYLLDHGIAVLAGYHFGNKIRLVTHRDINTEEIKQVITHIKDFFQSSAKMVS